MGLNLKYVVFHANQSPAWSEPGRIQLLDIVPKPVKAVILLFPWPGPWEAGLLAEDEKIKQEGQAPIDPNVVWIKQTVAIEFIKLPHS